MVDWGDDYIPTLRETMWGTIFIITLVSAIVLAMFLWGSM